MDSTYLTNPLVFLVQVLFGLYGVAVLLRFLFQLVRADFYNPISQFIVKITKPLLNPLRRIIPGYRGWDFASLVLAWLVLALEIGLVLALRPRRWLPQGSWPWLKPTFLRAREKG